MYGWVKQYGLAVPLLCALSCAQPTMPGAILIDSPAPQYRAEGRVRQVDDIAFERDAGELKGVLFTFYVDRRDGQGLPQRKALRVHASPCVGGSLEHLAGLRKGDAVYTQERFPSEMIDVCAKEIGPAQ